MLDGFAGLNEALYANSCGKWDPWSRQGLAPLLHSEENLCIQWLQHTLSLPQITVRCELLLFLLPIGKARSLRCSWKCKVSQDTVHRGSAQCSQTLNFKRGWDPLPANENRYFFLNIRPKLVQMRSRRCTVTEICAFLNIFYFIKRYLRKGEMVPALPCKVQTIVFCWVAHCYLSIC